MPKGSKPRNYGPRIDVTTLKISDAKPPAARIMPNKYDVFFAPLKVGQCVECQPEQANPLANAMRAWIKRHNKPGTVMVAKLCEDGLGRVWWVAKSPKLQRAA